jgi:uncharacterized RDD family membrane protein YckC
LANEARAALRAAEAASEAARQAKAAAESVLEGIKAASAAFPVAHNVETVVESDYLPLPETIAEPAWKEHMGTQVDDDQPLSILWAPGLPVRPEEPAEIHENLFEEKWWTPASAETFESGAAELNVVEAAQPINGNLIEFPRELVAPRRIRPRLAEPPHTADAHGAQLSIFEVDPETVATEPSEDTVHASSAGWSQPAWSGLELDEQLVEEREEALEGPHARPNSAHQLQPASFSRRMMAMIVDGSIIAGLVVAAAAWMLTEATVLPGVRTLELGVALGVVVFSAIYVTLFYAIAPATPGMKYAGIRFCTFEGLIPSRSQRWTRVGAMLLSVLPVGLGLAWALFDEDRLCWHDRLSHTYVGKR